VQENVMKASPISSGSAPHYEWGEGCEGWHLVRTDTLSVIEELMPPGTAERRHLHHYARQFFFVLAGELTIEIEGEEQLLLPHDGIEVAPGQAHRVFNRGDNPANFLVTSQPPSHGDRIDA
jgi:mannose-6-phosphate isomerase-like protein (cupin superfamily)